MGCDIHSVAQVKIKGKWKTVLQDVAGDNRNYDTFAVLANVRNGYGFAGVDTGDGFIPISQPRGYPKDFKVDDNEDHKISKKTPTGDKYEWADAKYRKSRLKEIADSTSVWMGDHSHSFHTLKEIKDYLVKMDTRSTIKRGFVNEKTYLELRKTRAHPEGWSGGISGANIVTMTEKQYLKAESEGKLPNGEIYVQYCWTVSYTEGTDISAIVEQLEGLAKKYKVEDTEVRFVFGFDS